MADEPLESLIVLSFHGDFISNIIISLFFDILVPFDRDYLDMDIYQSHFQLDQCSVGEREGTSISHRGAL